MSSYWITKRTKINKKRPRLVHIALRIIKSSRILLNFVAFENRSLVLLLLCYCTISLCLSLSLKCQCHKNLNIFSKIHDLNIQWDEMWAKNKNSLISNETFWENFPHFFAAIELQILSFQSILGIAPTSLFYIIFVLSKTVNMRVFELRISGVKKDRSANRATSQFSLKFCFKFSGIGFGLWSMKCCKSSSIGKLLQPN